MSKLLTDLSEEDAIELAEVATKIVGSWYYGGIDSKGEKDERIILSNSLSDVEFFIYPYVRKFSYHHLEYDIVLDYYAVDLVDKIRELGYELNTKEHE
jgi:hypothetical protein